MQHAYGAFIVPASVELIFCRVLTPYSNKLPQASLDVLFLREHCLEQVRIQTRPQRLKVYLMRL
jgi:hypothetical protein